MNSRRRGWEREVRHPMVKGIHRRRKFIIVVRVTHKFYIVEINGIRLKKVFHHRIPIKQVHAINHGGARFITTRVFRQFRFGTLGSWRKIPGSLIRVSMGGLGVWGVNKGNAIYYRLDIITNRRQLPTDEIYFTLTKIFDFFALYLFITNLISGEETGGCAMVEL